MAAPHLWKRATVVSHTHVVRTLLAGDPVGDWLFAPSPARETYLSADALTHKFRRLGRAAGVANPALHRLRHGVATYLVDQGKILKAQARLGHRDPSTTLRHYAHATMLDDLDVADDLDTILNRG